MNHIFCRIENALETMIGLIGAGMEYPDAHTRAMRLHDLISVADGNRLAAAYDNFRDSERNVP